MKACHSIHEIPRQVGKNDKNGTPVYEGDIIKSRFDKLFPQNITLERIVWMDGKFVLLQEGYAPDEILDGDIEMSEVVGNVLCKELIRG